MASKPQPRPTAKAPTKTAAKAGAVRKPAKSGYINARAEPGLKKNAEAVLDKIGMSTPEAVTIFLKQVVAQKGIPFPVKIPNRETIKAIRDAEKRTDRELFRHARAALCPHSW
jgi:DNA-damage-inducible protein J